jgi:hypothetical protein
MAKPSANQDSMEPTSSSKPSLSVSPSGLTSWADAVEEEMDFTAGAFIEESKTLRKLQNLPDSSENSKLEPAESWLPTSIPTSGINVGNSHDMQVGPAPQPSLTKEPMLLKSGPKRPQIQIYQPPRRRTGMDVALSGNTLPPAKFPATWEEAKQVAGSTGVSVKTTLKSPVSGNSSGVRQLQRGDHDTLGRTGVGLVPSRGSPTSANVSTDKVSPSSSAPVCPVPNTLILDRKPDRLHAWEQPKPPNPQHDRVSSTSSQKSCTTTPELQVAPWGTTTENGGWGVSPKAPIHGPKVDVAQMLRARLQWSRRNNMT